MVNINIDKNRSEYPVIDTDDDKGEIRIDEPSDLAETIKELNSDVLTEKSFSSIDTKTRLTKEEIDAIITIETLVGFNVMPVECLNLTRRKKRLNISIDGKGRDEIVKLVIGERENKQGMSGMEKFKNFFTGSQK